jgi:hypothetical protein
MKDKRGGDSRGDKVWGSGEMLQLAREENRGDTVCGSLAAESAAHVL